MITKSYETHGASVTVYPKITAYRSKMTFECKSTDVEIVNGKIANTFEDAMNADLLYFFDWKSLSDGEQAAAISQVWMLDEETGFWLPQ